MLTINIENLHITLNFSDFNEKKGSKDTLSVSHLTEKLNAAEKLASQEATKVDIKSEHTSTVAEPSVAVALANDSKKDLLWNDLYSASLPLFQALNKSMTWRSDAFKYGKNSKTMLRLLMNVPNDNADRALKVPSFVLKNKTALQELDNFCHFVETNNISGKIISQHVLLGLFNFFLDAKESGLPKIIQVLQEAAIALQTSTSIEQPNPSLADTITMLSTWPTKATKLHFDSKFKPVSDFIKSSLTSIFKDSLRNENVVEQMELAA